MTIRVTEGHIHVGVPGNSQKCPIALAIAGQVPWLFVAVGPRAIHVGHHILLTIPDEVSKWILAFDRREPVEPFSFELPDEVRS